MKLKKNAFYFLCLSVCGIGLASMAAAEESYDHIQKGFFQLSPFDSTSLNESDLSAGAHSLFSNSPPCLPDERGCVPAQMKKQAVRDAVRFHEAIREVIRKRLLTADGGKIPYTDEWREDGLLGIPAFRYHRIQFPSLLQRTGNHPANTVVIYYTVPARLAGCDYDYPTALIMHGATEDSVPDVRGMAESMVEVNRDKAAAYLILPHYDVRRVRPMKMENASESEKFAPDSLNDDYLSILEPEALRTNLVQSVLDIHLAVDLIRSFNRTRHPSTVSMVGLSMSGSMGLLFEGLEPGHIDGGHAYYGAGGNLAHVIQNYVVNQENEHISKIAVANHWREAKSRRDWAGFDPITWSARIRRSEFRFVHARYDKTFDYPNTFLPILNLLDSSNSVQESWIETEHYPKANFLYLAFHLFFPLSNFVIRHAAHPPAYDDCRPR